MGAGASVEGGYVSVEEALAAGKTQQEIDEFLRLNPEFNTSVSTYDGATLRGTDATGGFAADGEEAKGGDPDADDGDHTKTTTAITTTTTTTTANNSSSNKNNNKNNNNASTNAKVPGRLEGKYTESQLQELREHFDSVGRVTGKMEVHELVAHLLEQTVGAMSHDEVLEMVNAHNHDGSAEISFEVFADMMGPILVCDLEDDDINGGNSNGDASNSRQSPTTTTSSTLSSSSSSSHEQQHNTTSSSSDAGANADEDEYAEEGNADDFFKLVDANGDGLVDAEELREAYAGMGEIFTKQDVEEMIAQADRNGDGQIDIKEFALMFAS
jgi:Ca2+-binding EF-hand superfamily protein